jgi:hypothetical protein
MYRSFTHMINSTSGKLLVLVKMKTRVRKVWTLKMYRYARSPKDCAITTAYQRFWRASRESSSSSRHQGSQAQLIRHLSLRFDFWLTIKQIERLSPTHALTIRMVSLSTDEIPSAGRTVRGPCSSGIHRSFRWSTESAVHGQINSLNHIQRWIPNY